jgi:hypothetical protein
MVIMQAKLYMHRLSCSPLCLTPGYEARRRVARETGVSCFSFRSWVMVVQCSYFIPHLASALPSDLLAWQQTLQSLAVHFAVSRGPRPSCIVVKIRIWHSEDRASWYILIIKAKEMHCFSDLFDNVFYMFRTGPLSIIRSISTLYTRNRYLSF